MSQTILMAHPFADLYGSDRVLLETATAYVENGYQVHVALPGEGPLTNLLHARGIEVDLIPFPVLRKGLLSPRGAISLFISVFRCLPGMIRLLRQVRPSFILVNTVTIPIWILAARLCRIPVVCHVHEAEQSASTTLRKLLYSPLLASTGLVVNSRFSLGVLTKSWPRLARRAQVVYNGVAGPFAPEPPRNQIEGSARLLFIGRLSPRKGPQVAIEAARLLLASGTRIRLQLLGAVFPGYEWFEAQLIEQVRAADLESDIEFLGFDPNIWDRLSACDVVLVPSTVDEPFGNTAVEAMLAARPLIVSATSGLMEASTGYATARQVPPGEPQAIVEAVTDLLENWSEVVKRGEADRSLAIDRHSTAAYKRRVVQVISSMVH